MGKLHIVLTTGNELATYMNSPHAGLDVMTHRAYRAIFKNVLGLKFKDVFERCSPQPQRSPKTRQDV